MEQSTHVRNNFQRNFNGVRPSHHKYGVTIVIPHTIDILDRNVCDEVHSTYFMERVLLATDIIIEEIVIFVLY